MFWTQFLYWEWLFPSIKHLNLTDNIMNRNLSHTQPKAMSWLNFCNYPQGHCSMDQQTPLVGNYGEICWHTTYSALHSWRLKSCFDSLAIVAAAAPGGQQQPWSQPPQPGLALLAGNSSRFRHLRSGSRQSAPSALMVLTEAVRAKDKAALWRTTFSSGRWHTWRRGA